MGLGPSQKDTVVQSTLLWLETTLSISLFYYLANKWSLPNDSKHLEIATLFAEISLYMHDDKLSTTTIIKN